MRLYHYTCGHGRDGILADGYVRPNTHVYLPMLPPFIWLTDLDVPTREALGLTSVWLTCDRTEYRFDFELSDESGVRHWPAVAHDARLPRPVRDLLEDGGALPQHWYVLGKPLDVGGSGGIGLPPAPVDAA